MPLPRYSLDDGAEGSDEEIFEESYASNNAAASSSHARPVASSSRYSPSPFLGGAGPGRRSLSPSISTSAYGAEAPSSLDIDALLNDAPSTSSKPSAPRTGSSGWPYSTTSSISRMSAFEQLTHFMSTQKSAPELLPFPTSPFETLVSQMEQQQSILDNLLHLSQPPPSSTDDLESGIDEDEYLRLNLVQVDLERCKWLLKQIVRCRMDLLQKYAGFVQGRAKERRKLSETELRFVEGYWGLKRDHFAASVLGFLPEQLGELESGANQGGETLSQQEGQNSSTNMVPGPDLDAPVFVRALDECGEVSLPDGGIAGLSKDSVHLLRYRSVRHLVYQGSVVLL